MINIPYKELLTKEDELRLVDGMERTSFAILLFLFNKGALKDILEDLYESLLKGTCSISYQSVTRERMKKAKLLKEFKKVIDSLSIEALERMRFNYLLCYQFAQEYLKTRKSKDLEVIRDKYLHYRDQLINHNLRIAFQAKNALRTPIVPTSYDSDDVFMVAYDALVNASGRYDKRWNCRFYSYATWSVLAAVHRFVREQISTMVIPQAFHTKRRQALDTLNAAEQELGRSTSLEELGLSESTMPFRLGDWELNSIIDQDGYDRDTIDRIVLLISQKAREIFDDDEFLVFENDILFDEFLDQFYNTLGGDLEDVRERMLKKFRETRKRKRSIK